MSVDRTHIGNGTTGGFVRTWNPPRLCLIGILGLAVITGVLLSVGEESRADSQSIDLKTLATFEPGEVTANYGQTIVISNKQYSVLPSVAVTDDEGRMHDLNEVVPGLQVRFHLRNEKIDYLVIMLPR